MLVVTRSSGCELTEESEGFQTWGPLSPCRELWTQFMASHKQYRFTKSKFLPTLVAFALELSPSMRNGMTMQHFNVLAQLIKTRNPGLGHDLLVDYPSQDWEKASQYVGRISVDSDIWGLFWTRYLSYHYTVSVFELSCTMNANHSMIHSFTRNISQLYHN